MNAYRRYEKIMEALLARREVTVAELSDALDVTGKTIREDLAKLEEQGLLRRVHGGAVLAQDGQFGLLTGKGANVRHQAEKTEIARSAVKLIEPGDIIALDVGSTTLEIARLLGNDPLTVVTNDVNIISELSRKDAIRLVVPGGYRVRNMLVGAESESYIRKLNIRKAFVSATGVHPKYGFTVFTGDLLSGKRTLLETAQTSYCVADHYKFGQIALRTFARLDEVKAIITDSGIDPSVLETFRQAGVHIVAGQNESERI